MCPPIGAPSITSIRDPFEDLNIFAVLRIGTEHRAIMNCHDGPRLTSFSDIAWCSESRADKGENESKIHFGGIYRYK